MARTINASTANAAIARRFLSGVCTRVTDSAAGAAPQGVWVASRWGAPTVAGPDADLAGGNTCSAVEVVYLEDDVAELSAGAAMRPVSVSRLRRFKSLRRSEAC